MATRVKRFWCAALVALALALGMGMACASPAWANEEVSGNQPAGVSAKVSENQPAGASSAVVQSGSLETEQPQGHSANASAGGATSTGGATETGTHLQAGLQSEQAQPTKSQSATPAETSTNSIQPQAASNIVVPQAVSASAAAPAATPAATPAAVTPAAAVPAAASASNESTSTQLIKNGQYVIQSSVKSSQVLDVKNGSKANGANVQLYQSNMTGAQRWNVTHDDKGYIFTNAGSGKVLSVAASAARNSINVYQTQAAGQALWQRWNIIATERGYVIVSALDPNFVLDVSGGKSRNGTNVQIYRQNGTAAQAWRFLSTSPEVSQGTDLGLNGWYKIAASGDSNYVVDVKGGSTANGANVQLYQSNHTLAQFFKFTFENGYYRITNARADKALDAYQGNVVDGTNVTVRSDATAANSQLFKVTRNDSGAYAGTYTFINKANGLALDISGGKIRNTSNIQTYTQNGTAAQAFWLLPVDSVIIQGLVSIRPTYVDRYVDVAGAKTADGTNVQLYQGNATLAQKWYVHYNSSDKTYRFQSVSSNKYLGLSGNNVVIVTGSTDNSQKWKAAIKNGGIELLNVATNNALEVLGGGISNGTNVLTAAVNNGQRQRFLFPETVPLANGLYTIATALSGSMMLDVNGGSHANSANVQIYSSNNTNAQKWRATRNGDGTYTFINAESNKALDVRGGVAAAGTNVQQYNSNGTAAQRWYMVYADGYKLVSAKNRNYVLEVAGAGTANSTNVRINQDANSTAQKWTFAGTKYNDNMTPEQRRMYNQAQGYSSPNSWLVIVDRNTNRMGIFRGSKGNWKLTKFVKCTTGKSSTPTPKGEFKVIDRKPSFGSGYTCWYATRFRMNGYYFHSVLYKQGSKTKILDGRLGQNLSHGCVRLDINDARYVYNNLPNNSRVVVR